MRLTRGSATGKLGFYGDGFAACKMTGLVLPGVVKEIGHAMANAAAGHDVPGVLHDMTGASLAFGVDDMSTAGSLSRKAKDTPAAFVVLPHDVELLGAYAEEAGRSGILRAVFTCERVARAWLSRQAELAQAERARHLRRLAICARMHPAQP